MPPCHFEDEQDPPFLEWHEDEGFYESLKSGHPECEPHLVRVTAFIFHIIVF